MKMDSRKLPDSHILYGGKTPINPGWYLPPWMAVSSPGYRHVVRRPWRNELERETGRTSVLPDPRQ